MQYFVKHWKSGKPLRCLEVSSRKIQTIDANCFLRKEKYKVCYNFFFFFWRFTSSLLQDDYEMDQFYSFFDMIEKELQDIFGPTHQRLVLEWSGSVQADVAFYSTSKKPRKSSVTMAIVWVQSIYTWSRKFLTVSVWNGIFQRMF